jgi:hypothetical protein
VIAAPAALKPGVPVWRGDIDALGFRPEGHLGLCFVHRLAFRALLGAAPETRDCLAFFRMHAGAFEAAAAAKRAARSPAATANFHLTSRDLAAMLAHCRHPLPPVPAL